MKIGFTTILAIVGLILVLLGYITHPGIASLVTGLILIFVGLTVLVLKVKNETTGTRVLNGLIWAVTVLIAVNQLGWLGEGSSPTPLSAPMIETNVQTQTGAEQSATMKLNVKGALGETYSGTGTIYALKPGVASNRNDLMKLVQEGKTQSLTPNSMSLSSGVYSYNGYAGKIGDTVYFAGYKDSTPGAAENVSFVATSTITGMTAGSTPEWMISNPQFVWYNYPTLLFYNYADTAVTVYTEDEDSAIEKTVTISMFPTNNGEQWTDAILWVEAPESNIAAIKQVKITPEFGDAVTYSGVPQEVTSAENLFRAVPSLTTATNKMYKVGAFPNNGLTRISSSQKGRQTIEVTYDHPASGNVNFYFKVTQNSNALTSAGGHYDSPATNFNLNATAGGTDAWT